MLFSYSLEQVREEEQFEDRSYNIWRTVPLLEFCSPLFGAYSYDEADSMYRLGIARRAQPLDRLKKRYTEFQQRIMMLPSLQGASGSRAQSAPTTYAASLAAAMQVAGRSMLGSKTDSSTGASSLHSNAVRGLGGSGGLGSGLGSRSQAPANNGRKLAIYQDDDDDHDEKDASNPSATKAGWKDLGTSASRRQENVQEPKQWRGERLPQRSSALQPKKPGGGLIIFRDSDDEGDETNDGARPNNSIMSPGAGDVFARVTKKQPTETDLLRKNPFMHWGADAKLKPKVADITPPEIHTSSGSKSRKESSSKSSSSSGKREKSSSSGSSSRRTEKGSSSKDKASSSSGAKNERVAVPLALLYPGISLDEAIRSRLDDHNATMSTEVCIEELLAGRRGWLADSPKDDPWSHLDEVEGVWLPMPEEEQQEKEQPLSPSRNNAVDQNAPMDQDVPDSPPPSRDVFDPDNSAANAEALGMRPRAKKTSLDNAPMSVSKNRIREDKPPSPTMVTKAMSREIENMFNGSDSEDEDSDDDDDDDDDDEEGEDVVPASMPPLRGMMTHSTAVPPTPTPAARGQPSGGLASGRNARLPEKSNDENAGVQATPSRPPAMMNGRQPLGMSTPMRTPLGAKPHQPLGSKLTAGPLVIHRDEDEEDQPVAVAHTPAPAPYSNAHPAASRVHAALHEEEEEDDEDDDDFEDERERYEVDEAGDPILRARGVPLTPITEATHEFTRWTARTPGTATKTGSLMRSYRSGRSDSETAFTEQSDGGEMLLAGPRVGEEGATAEEEDAGERAFVQSMTDPTQATDQMDNQQETDQPVLNRQLLSNLPPSVRDNSEDRSFASSNGTFSGTFDDRSNWGGKAPFELTEGLTIDRADGDRTGNLAFGRSFSIVDRTKTLSLREGEVEGADEPSRSESKNATRDAKNATPAKVPSTFVPPNPCSPADPDVIAGILSSLELPIESSPDYVDLSGQNAGGKLDALQKRAKMMLRRSVGSAASVPKDWTLEIDEKPFAVREKLGEGGYGAVFLAEDVTGAVPLVRKPLGGIIGDASFEAELAAEFEDDEEDDEEAERRRLVAVKVESPPNKWEFYILGQLRARLPPTLLSSVISARKFYAYADESFLLLEYGEKGTLLEVVNNAPAAGVASSGALATGGANGGAAGVDEVLAIFFAIELLRLLEGLHRNNLLHGDLKIDNCLLRLDEPPVGQTWSNSYTRDGSYGWASKGLTMIDFGRAIDLSRFPQTQTFIADWSPDARDCPEMREARPWTYQTDYYGVASICYCMLFGKYIETVALATPAENGTKRYRISQTLRRYWQVDLWTKLFDALLNPKGVRDDAALPITDELADIRQEMEEWLEMNCNRAGKVSASSATPQKREDAAR